MLRKITFCAALLLSAAACATDEPEEQVAPQAQEPASAATATERLGATAELRDAQNQVVGTAALEEGDGGVRISAELSGLPQGTHAFHLHETGECAAPAFTSAGGHFNPTGAQHGLENPQGPHAGDMENIEVGSDGAARVSVENERVTLSSGPSSLLDADGSALVVHAGADDNVSDPSGNAGDRIACGVITRN